jgi:hypothetical protein
MVREGTGHGSRGRKNRYQQGTGEDSLDVVVLEESLHKGDSSSPTTPEMFAFVLLVEYRQGDNQ